MGPRQRPLNLTKRRHQTLPPLHEEQIKKHPIHLGEHHPGTRVPQSTQLHLQRSEALKRPDFQRQLFEALRLRSLQQD